MKLTTRRSSLLLTHVSLLALVAGAAEAAPPEAAPLPPPIATPREMSYPGAIDLHVDATDVVRHVFAVHETIPVGAAGDLVLHYPKWIPGNHGPTGPLPLLAGLVIHAGATTLPWRRDAVDMYAFHVPVPAGTRAVDVDFQFLSPVEPDQGRVVMTPVMLDLQWNTVVLYPAGVDARDLAVDPTVTLPAGWHIGTALEATGAGGNAAATGTVRFRPVTLNVLVDSPLYAGLYFERVDLAPGATPPVHLDIVADKPAELAMTSAQLAVHRAVATQATKLFGAHHYDHYDFLLALSDELGGEGLEHHRSSEDATDGNYFTAWDKTPEVRDLLSHEYTHSWNGKFRRPADLYSPDFNTIPERDSLLWVYEGLTEYWGQVLAARSGLWSHQQALDSLALEAAEMQDEVGRAWRPLEDTTNNPIFVFRRGQPWENWQRSEDYYTEGELIWLDADTLIRERTHGAKSLDDFARAFFGIDDGSWTVSTYGFDDVVRALDAVTPYDWAGFLRTRLDRTGGPVPFDGITRGGYRLVMTDTPSPIETAWDAELKSTSFAFSAGLDLKDGKIVDVAWNSPAWKAGLVEGDEITGIDGATFDGPEDLADAIKAARGGGHPISLLVTSGKHYRTVDLDVRTGLQHPHLVRAGTGAASLDAILGPRR